MNAQKALHVLSNYPEPFIDTDAPLNRLSVVMVLCMASDAESKTSARIQRDLLVVVNHGTASSVNGHVGRFCNRPLGYRFSICRQNGHISVQNIEYEGHIHPEVFWTLAVDILTIQPWVSHERV